MPSESMVQVGWLGPYGLIPGGMDQDSPVPSWWQPVYVERQEAPERPVLTCPVCAMGAAGA